MSQQPVKVGIVGAGIFGVMHLRAFSQLAKQGGCQLVGFVARREEQRKERESQFGVPGFASFEEMADKAAPDAITIVTPDHAHKEYALKAAQRGMHVLSEKPLDTAADGCREIITACKKAGVLLQVDFHKRYDPEHINAHNAVKSGQMGEVLYASAHMEDRIEVPSEWFPNWAPDSSPAWFLGVHFFDLIRWIIQAEPVSVWATGSKKRLKNDFGIDTYDCVNTKVQFDNGASGAFDMSWIIPKSFEAIVNQGCRIVGTKGVYEIDSQDRGAVSCMEGDGMRTYNNNFFRELPGKDGSTEYAGYGVESIIDFVHNVQYVMQHGIDSRPPGVWADGFDGLQATKMALAAHQSIETGEVVRLSKD